MLNELVNNRVTELNAVAAGGAAADPLVLRTRALSPQLKNLIASRVTVPAVKTELLKP